MNDERLRQILRRGDPAGEDGGLTPDEARPMRRTVLTAVPERKRRFLPVFALAGAAATAALLAVLLLRPEPAQAPIPPPRIATAPAPPAPPIAQIPAEPTPRPAQKGEERRPVHRYHSPHHHRPAAPEPPAIHDTLASLETAETERQVQFSTPGGTRIIWILKSGKASR
ncbi:MAG TPA: hypothetical protein VIJ36_08490 [Thermoanaerobaculia bacterium]